MSVLGALGASLGQHKELPEVPRGWPVKSRGFWTLGILGAQLAAASGSDADPAARNPPYTRAGGKDDVSS